MKKIISVVLVLMMVLGLCTGCTVTSATVKSTAIGKVGKALVEATARQPEQYCELSEKQVEEINKIIAKLYNAKTAQTAETSFAALFEYKVDSEKTLKPLNAAALLAYYYIEKLPESCAYGMAEAAAQSLDSIARQPEMGQKLVKALYQNFEECRKVL